MESEVQGHPPSLRLALATTYDPDSKKNLHKIGVICKLEVSDFFFSFNGNGGLAWIIPEVIVGITASLDHTFF